MTTQGRTVLGPERLEGQGLDPHQEESGNLAILKLLTADHGPEWTDWVATYRHNEVDPAEGAYEVWARRGMVRFRRVLDAGGAAAFEVIETLGENPIADQDPSALATVAEEMAAAGTDDENAAFIPPEATSYPFAYERIAALFDSPNAPDLVVNPCSYAYGRQPGQHGAMDVVQSRSPLVFSGPGVRQGVVVDSAFARQIDVAPTIARLCGFPLIDGRDHTGRTSSERGVSPDVYLARQDGRVLDEVIAAEASPGGAAERAVIFLLDGLSNSELRWRLEQQTDGLPNLRRLVAAGSMYAYGSITNFPSITWPSHNAIGTGAWCGHHDIVNPTYYLRAERETVSPQGQQFDTARFLNDRVETLFEAFHRVHGELDGADGALTASLNEPCTRGADHANLERRMLGERQRLIEVTEETLGDISPRWREEYGDTSHGMAGVIDNRALAQARMLLLDEDLPAPRFMFIELTATDSIGHEAGGHSALLRLALDETDVRIGRILDIFDAQGLTDSTLFVVTTDHGMAEQRVDWQANAARIPERDGMAAVTTEPLVYLRDLRVEVEVKADGRTATVTVLDNDPDTTGERPPVAGAQVLVADLEDGRVAEVETDAYGQAGFAVPADMEPHELVMSVSAAGFNHRHLRLDSAALALDLREALYGMTPE